MRSLDYELWADYILDLIDLYPVKKRKVLEVGAGSGQVSKFLKSEFSNLFISDSSSDMLSKSPKDFKRVVCRMEELPFEKEFDVIFSIFDSVNYLTRDESFVDFLSQSSQALTENGILCFDVSLEKNSRQNARSLNRNGTYKGIKYQQVSKYDATQGVHKNIVEMKYDRKVFTEIHIQRIYKFEEYFDFAKKADLIVLDAFDCFTFEDADKQSERVQFVMGKKNAGV